MGMACSPWAARSSARSMSLSVAMRTTGRRSLLPFSSESGTEKGSAVAKPNSVPRSVGTMTWSPAFAWLLPGRNHRSWALKCMRTGITVGM